MNETLMKRQALAKLMERYLEGIIEKDASKIPVSPSCKVTYNGKVGKFGDNELWYNTLNIKNRQSFFDAETGGIVFLGVTSNEVLERCEHFIHEKTNTTDFISYAVVIRLKVVDGAIVEVEELAWSGRYRYFYCLTQDIQLPDPMFETSIPLDERMTREELIEVAESYWEGGFGDMSPEDMLVHPDAERYENGYRTTNHSHSFRGDFKWNPPLIKSGENRPLDVPREYRSYPVVDPARGIVISMVTMVPRTESIRFRIAEVFLVREGCIKRIIAMYPKFYNDGGWKQTNVD